MNPDEVAFAVLTLAVVLKLIALLIEGWREK